jgi:hypothetical protein
MHFVFGFFIVSGVLYWLASNYFLMLLIGALGVGALYYFARSGEAVPDGTGAPAEEKNGAPVNARLKIRYRDSEGAETQRTIYAISYMDSSPGYIHARCELSRGNRTFRTDRIVEAVDLETGEVIKRIPTFMRSKYVEAPTVAKAPVKRRRKPEKT